MNINNKIKIILINIFLFLITADANASKIIVASTTSTYDTGLLNLLNEKFYDKYNIRVQVLSLGTGQAIRTAKDGNAEILLVHHKPSEEEFMNNGYGEKRYEIMYNDYVLVGPKKDNGKCSSVQQKLEEIYNNKSLFISRGDDSGTHLKELESSCVSFSFIPAAGSSNNKTNGFNARALTISNLRKWPYDNSSDAKSVLS